MIDEIISNYEKYIEEETKKFSEKLEGFRTTLKAMKAYKEDRNVKIEIRTPDSQWQVLFFNPLWDKNHYYRVKENAPLTQEQAKGLLESIIYHPKTQERFVVYSVWDRGIGVVSLKTTIPEFSSKPVYFIGYENLMSYKSATGIQLYR
jgi:hypothetical protein